MEPATVDKQTQDQKKKQAALYKAIWRLHFYAGIIFAPFLIILAITGSVYLFKPQIEQMLYQDFYEVKQQKERIAPSEQLDIVTNHYAGAVVTSYRPGEQATHSSEVNITYQNESLTVFVDPYNGNILWITGGLLFLILTGLPWSGFWGTNFQALVTNTGEGYPPSVWVGAAPTSNIKTKDIAEVPWAAETLDVPKSKLEGFLPVSIDDIVEIAEREGMHPSYSVIFPSSKEGVYTLSAFPPKAKDEATIHIDQYTGAVLADYRYDNYGPIGKIVAVGITLHKGTELGFLNQLVSLLICLGTLLVAFTGVYMWWKRKPNSGLGAPKAPKIKNMKLLLFLLIILGILFPLVGLSLIFVWLIDLLIIQRMPKAKRFLNA